MLGDALRNARERRGVTQAELAGAIHVSAGALSNYECGSRLLPRDVLRRASVALRSDHLRLLLCSECDAGFFAGTPLLDRVDTHPNTTKFKLLEELREAVGAVEEMNLINRLRPADLRDRERARMGRELLQVKDVAVAIAMLLVSLAENLDLDLMELDAAHRRKLLDRGYWSARASRREAMGA